MGGHKNFLKNINIRTFVMIGTLLIIWFVFTACTEGAFLTARNISNLLRQTAIIGIMGISMVLVIVTCGIDLSCGASCGMILLAVVRFDLKSQKNSKS